MRPQLSHTKPIILLAFCAIGLLLPPSVTAQTGPKFVIKPIAEKKLARLPTGPLYWWVENFPTLAQAQAAEGATSLAAETAGKAWLLTLAPRTARSLVEPRWQRSAPCHRLPRPNICSESPTAAARREPRRQCTPILVPKPSMC